MKKLSNIKTGYVTFIQNEKYKGYEYKKGQTYRILDVPTGYLDRCVRIGCVLSSDKVKDALEDVRPDSFLNEALEARENREMRILERIELIKGRRKLLKSGLKTSEKTETVKEEEIVKEESSEEEKLVESELIEKEEEISEDEQLVVVESDKKDKDNKKDKKTKKNNK